MSVQSNPRHDQTDEDDRETQLPNIHPASAIFHYGYSSESHTFFRVSREFIILSESNPGKQPGQHVPASLRTIMLALSSGNVKQIPMFPTTCEG
jgi:hypothetical protein